MGLAEGHDFRDGHLPACLLFVLGLAACSAPVGVDQVDLRTACDDLNRSTLSSDELSEGAVTLAFSRLAGCVGVSACRRVAFMRSVTAAIGFRPIIQHSVWLYLRFTLSFKNVEGLLAEREITVSYESIRRWVAHFGSIYARRFRAKRPGATERWHLDEVFVSIANRQVLWRAVDDEGEALDILV